MPPPVQYSPSSPRSTAVRIAIDMVSEGVITKAEAVARVEPGQVDQLLRDQFDPAARTAAEGSEAARPRLIVRVASP